MSDTQGTTAALEGATPDPVGTGKDECVHLWCEYAGEGHRDHESAGVYVAATGNPRPSNVDIDGARFPVLRVFLSAEDENRPTVAVFVGGLEDKRDHELELTLAEAAELRDALAVMLGHAATVSS